MKKIIAVAGLGAAIAIGSLTGAGTASADSGTRFLDQLNDYGIHVYDSSQAIATGHRLCNEMYYASGYAVANRLYRTTSWSDVPNRETARLWVGAAADNFCPEAW